jgi:hypothetical protein
MRSNRRTPARFPASRFRLNPHVIRIFQVGDRLDGPLLRVGTQTDGLRRGGDVLDATQPFEATLGGDHFFEEPPRAPVARSE